LYLGDHVVFFANFLLNAANSADIHDSYTKRQYPTSYNMVTFGAAIKFDSWW